MAVSKLVLDIYLAGIELCCMVVEELSLGLTSHTEQTIDIVVELLFFLGSNSPTDLWHSLAVGGLMSSVCIVKNGELW